MMARTPAPAWAPPTRKITLPCGLTVEYKLPGPLCQEAANEQIPDLQQVALAAENLRKRAETDPDSVLPEELTQMAIQARQKARRSRIINVVFCAVNPRFTDATSSTNGAIAIEDLPAADFDALADGIIGWANEEVEREAAEIVPLSETQGN